jgi:hypothetical protein
MAKPHSKNTAGTHNCRWADEIGLGRCGVLNRDRSEKYFATFDQTMGRAAYVSHIPSTELAGKEERVSPSKLRPNAQEIMMCSLTLQDV